MGKVCLFLLFLLCLMPGCGRHDNEVVVYTSVDQVFSEPILRDFEKQTGIRVKAVYDVEATKTTGLVNRLLAESPHPQADVFWNSEIARTIFLKNKGILEPYVSPQAQNIPALFKDKEGSWTGFAARARILIYNTQLLAPDELPGSIFELTQPQWRGKVALGNPLFGTTATHMAALFVALGKERATQFFRELKENGIVMVDGNSVSRDRVQEGNIPLGFTDTDDAHVALVNRQPVGVIYPDQREEEIGTLFFPNTVCLIKNSPHPGNGRRLIDYLLSEEVESRLAFSESAQIPLREGVQHPAHVVPYHKIKAMNVDFERVAQEINESARILQDIFFR